MLDDLNLPSDSNVPQELSSTDNQVCWQWGKQENREEVGLL
jgi:hypothetical protein